VSQPVASHKADPSLHRCVVLCMLEGQALAAEAERACHAVKTPSFKLPVGRLG